MRNKCEHCNNTKFVKQGKKSVPCTHCMNEERLMNSIRRAIEDSRREGKTVLASHLTLVLSYLPDYPVIAMLEAEEMHLNSSLIMMIQDAFDVRPLGDVTYAAEKKVVDTAE